MTNPATATADTQTGDLNIDDAIASEIAQDAEDAKRDEAPDKVEKIEPKTEVETPEVEDDEDKDKLEGEPTPEDIKTDPEEETSEDENTDVVDPVVVLDAPARWDADGKAKFEKLDDELKVIILDREKAAQAEITKRQMEAADLRKQVDAGTTNQNAELTQVLNQARTQFAGKYADITPQALAEFSALSPEHAQQAAQVKLEMDAEQQTLNDLEIQNKKVEVAAHIAFVEEQRKLMPELVPELIDPEKGEALRAEVGKHLQKAGIDENAVKHISTVELSMAYGDMMYRKIINQKKTAKPAAPRQGKSVKVAPARSSGGINAKAQLAKMIKASDGSMESEIAIQLFEDEHFT